MRKAIRLTESHIKKIVTESIRNLILESKMDFNYLYMPNDGDDITKYIFDYINWSKYGERNPTLSTLACQLHDELMGSLCLSHEKDEDRRIFARIINYCKSVDGTVGINKIIYRPMEHWEIIPKIKDCESATDFWIDQDDFSDGNFKINGVVYETRDGVNELYFEWRKGSHNGYTGYYVTSAVMDDSMKQKIYGMHLVPALMVLSSYHSNFVRAVGVLPEFVQKIKNNKGYNDVFFFDCEFKNI